ncbi:MAG: SWIM zinc finger family protein, partial [Lachnospiraceae bacterium]|nr:SWIM zinc finger family protein [Lachnospiraceae bacterium]
MIEITEQQILAFAPNTAAASNGKKISQKGGFIKLERTSDNILYIGECKGSGKNNYITSADYIDQISPVFRCSCPSRQYPCKHSLALLYDTL